MGCLVEKTDTGQEVQVHIHDDQEKAIQYVVDARGYDFDRHEPWAFGEGLDLYYFMPDSQGNYDHHDCNRACIRKIDGQWRSVFWRE